MPYMFYMCPILNGFIYVFIYFSFHTLIIKFMNWNTNGAHTQLILLFMLYVH